VRVVFDTSILVAAARSKRGASHALLSRLPDPQFTTVISVALFLEYRAALLRPQNLLTRTAEEADRFLDYLLSISVLQDIFFHWRPALRDPDDDLVLEAAVASSGMYIITHNLRDFRGVEQWGIQAITPARFLESLALEP
jgi:putative PIN family toxin of toxin-antitoxin system